MASGFAPVALGASGAAWGAGVVGGSAFGAGGGAWGVGFAGLFAAVVAGFAAGAAGGSVVAGVAAVFAGEWGGGEVAAGFSVVVALVAGLASGGVVVDWGFASFAGAVGVFVPAFLGALFVGEGGEFVSVEVEGFAEAGVAGGVGGVPEFFPVELGD